MVWAHWDRSFDMHPDSPGLVSCSFPPGVPSAPLWVAAVTEAWRWAALCLQQAFPQGASWGGGRCSGLTAMASFVYWCGRQGIYFNYKKELDLGKLFIICLSDLKQSRCLASSDAMILAVPLAASVVFCLTSDQTRVAYTVRLNSHSNGRMLFHKGLD